MKTVFKIVFCVISCFITLSSFGQEFSDQQIGLDVARITKRLQERGIDEKGIQQEISRYREQSKQNFLANEKIQNEYLEKIIKNQVAKVNNSNLVAPTDIPANEKAALQALYNNCGGSSWYNNTGWDFSTPVTSWAGTSGWYGISVDNGHVVSIGLNGLGTGTLPDLSSLSFLNYLSLFGNYSGTLSGLQNLINLKTLNLSSNSGNNIGSILPICNLINLETFYIGYFNSNETIPQAFFNLINLKYLRLGSNFLGDFSGIGNLINLNELWLANNSFSSGGYSNTTIPISFQNLVNLKKIYIDNINLSQNLSVLGSLTKLTHIKMFRTNFSGPLPINFSALTSLEAICFDGFNGQFNHISDITSISNLTGLKYIQFGSNNLTFIPSGFQNLTNLRYVDLNSNNITGNIPSYFSNFQNLSALFLSGNKFEGDVPLIKITNVNSFYNASITQVLNFYSGDKVFYIGNNKFRFKNLLTDFANYKTNIPTYFSYSPQANIDALLTENKLVGQSVTMTMYVGGSAGVDFHSGDTFQWFKGGVAITGATNRIYTIPSLVANDAGIYTCKSSHTTNPDMSPLILEREPITLNITAVTLNSCPETFEGTTFPPTGWLVANNGIGLVNEWVANTTTGSAYAGAKVAFVDRENIGINKTSEDWLVTPRLTVPANGELRFFTKQSISGNQGTVYQVRVTTSNVTQANITTSFPTVTQAYTETTLNTAFNVYEEKVINLSAFVGQQVNIAFVKIYTQPTATIGGDRWFIDNVKVVQACGLPSALTISPITVTTANVGSTTLSWQANGATQWEVFFGLTSSSQSLPGTLVNTNSFSVSGIVPGQLYYYRVKSVCTSCDNGYKSDWVYSSAFSGPSYCTQDVPTNLVLSNNTGTSCIVAWSAVPNAVSYEVAIVPTTAGLIDPTGYPITAVTTLNYTFSSLLSNLAYTIFVRSVCSTGQKSSWVTKTTEKPVACAFIPKDFLEELLNFLRTQTTLPNGYTCSQLTDLAPYITDVNPSINNFTNSNGVVKFNFSNHGILYGLNDVEFSYTVGYTQGFKILSLAPQFSYDNIGNQGTMYDCYSLQSTNKLSIRHINYCPPVCNQTNPGRAIVKQLFINLVNHLKTLPAVPNGYTCPQLSALAPYITDANPAIYNYGFATTGNLSFSFSNHQIPPIINCVGYRYLYNQDVYLYGPQPTTYPTFGNMTDINVSSYISPEIYIEDVQGIFENGFAKTWVRHINFCPTIPISCTVGNAKSEVVKDLFIKLINHLKKQVIVPDNYICNELVALSAYTTDRNPRIYGFSTANNTISFRFHPTPTTDTDVSVQNWTSTVTTPVTVNAINVSNYFDSNTAFSLNNFMTLSNGTTIPLASIKHINFCPTELCKKHIAIVVDESGSISIEEARKIRKQLKNFVIAQADANVTTQTNTYVSLIGMSDSDSGANVRTDHNIGNSRIDATNLQSYLNWIEDYRTQRPLMPVITGLSRSSDFWNSGLQKALDIKADYVVLITDGCESANVPLLKQTLSQFDNYQNPNGIKAGPHLYVVGIESGFYIDASTVANRIAAPKELAINKNNSNDDDEVLSRELASNDPNSNPNLSQSSETNRSEGYLTKSLKYLLNYAITTTPPFINLDKYDFLTADYFGSNDFDFLSTEKDYVYNNLQKISITCGGTILQQVCDNCSGYKPIPGKDYLLSAWVKEERNEQVIKYTLPKIKLVFNKFSDDGSTGAATGAPVLFSTSDSDIIEGWQRIFGKFSIPIGTDVLSIELVNESTTVPVYFDDVRIHPVDGSMKSFVYDPETFKLMSELDENNYATFYEYDKEGGLVRVKKETAKGIKTIQETRSGSVIKQ